MEHPERGFIDFVSEQLQRKKEEQEKQADRLVITYRNNLTILLATWRFILVTRAAFFALAGASLQYILQHMKVFLDTSQLVVVMEMYQGLPSALLNVVRLLTPVQAANLVALIVLAVVLIVLSIDRALAVLQRKCVLRGLEAEQYLNINGLFFEIDRSSYLILLPFGIAWTTVLLFGIMSLWYLAIK